MSLKNEWQGISLLQQNNCLRSVSYNLCSFLAINITPLRANIIQIQINPYFSLVKYIKYDIINT